MLYSLPELMSYISLNAEPWVWLFLSSLCSGLATAGQMWTLSYYLNFFTKIL